MFRLALLVFLLSGCSFLEKRPGPTEYIPVPEGYLQPCELPAVPDITAGLSDAFVVAYKCAEQGNKDKMRIRNLSPQS